MDVGEIGEEEERNFLDFRERGEESKWCSSVSKRGESGCEYAWFSGLIDSAIQISIDWITLPID